MGAACCSSFCLPYEEDISTELDGSYVEMNNTAQPTTLSAVSLLPSAHVFCHHAIGTGISGVVFKGLYRGSVVAVKNLSVPMPTKESARVAVEASLEVEAMRMGRYALSC